MKQSIKIMAMTLVTCMWLAVSAMISVAEDDSKASGRFETKNASVEVFDAYAFYSLGGKGKDKIIVVISNQEFAKDVIDQYWDRKRAIERYYRDEKTATVFFEFSPEGQYRGLSYYFGPGDGCAYCGDPSVKSTVSLEGGKMTGKLGFPKDSDSKRWFEISLNVPVSDDDHGKSQGTGGGEPGKAYMAYHRALIDGDPRAVRALSSERHRSAWAKAESEERGDEILSNLKEDHPKDLQVTGAYVKADKALILLEGKGETGEVHGEAQLLREKGAWLFNDEAFSTTDQ
jgi:hypothetical protein